MENSSYKNNAQLFRCFIDTLSNCWASAWASKSDFMWPNLTCPHLNEKGSIINDFLGKKLIIYNSLLIFPSWYQIAIIFYGSCRNPIGTMELPYKIKLYSSFIQVWAMFELFSWNPIYWARIAVIANTFLFKRAPSILVYCASAVSVWSACAAKDDNRPRALIYWSIRMLSLLLIQQLGSEHPNFHIQGVCPSVCRMPHAVYEL